jgi:hypothetical protein
MAETTTRTRAVNSTVAAVAGAGFALAGLVGFFISENVVSKTDSDLLGFQVNHLHNVVHLLIGLALLAASKRQDTARSANLAIGGTYLLLGVLGPLLDGSALDVIALNSADNGLHLVSGLLLVGVGVAADKEQRA